jgi:hypothetical protein
MQAARADVLALLVHPHREGCQLIDRIRAKLERDVLGGQQRLVLLDERVFGLRQNRFEVVRRPGLELDADRKASLQLGDEVGGFADVEGTCRDEEDVVGFDGSMLCADRRPFDDRQNVALHAFAGNVRTAARTGARYLIDLVDKDNSVLAGPP